MNESNIKLPFGVDGISITLIYLRKYDNQLDNSFSQVDYLHTSRSPAFQSDKQLSENKRLQYESGINSCVNKILETSAKWEDADIIVSAPSKSDYQKPYFDKVKLKTFNAKDLTEKFSKGIRAGDPGNFKKFYSEFHFDKKEMKPIHYNKLLIVDDVYSDGKTVSAIVNKLVSAEITFNSYFVICPLLIEHKDKIDYSKFIFTQYPEHPVNDK
ncbi:MAG: hypothetical protein HF314_18520 [Ignavibacteria bacterium]|jgi:hypothetical protein|nr:hypothetical protein [Ignavibacteria bacterium]MCU7505083.1 hypothetical protein [Ignavibacteria bacterium]MCU7518085.1 hypothetical protein [Ignavibacteria bacterium]